MTILTLGVIGAIAFTAVTHADGVAAIFNGVDRLYQSAVAGALGRVA